MCSVSGTYFDEVRKIWSGPDRKPFYSPEMTLGDAILHSLSMIPEKIVQVFDPTGETLTAGELLGQSKAVAVNLIKMGLQPGDVVGISANNTPNLTAVVLASFLCGMPTHAVYPEFDKETIKPIFNVSKPKVIFCDVENYDVTKKVIEELLLESSIFVLNGKIADVQSANELFSCTEESMTLKRYSFPCTKLHGSNVAMILCSSGTSGPPKGVMNTHTALLNQGVYFNINTDSVLFAFSTLYWSSGMWTLLASLKDGVKRVITNKPFTSEYFMHIFEKHGVTHTFTSPNQIAQIITEYDSKAQYRLNSLHTALCGGAKVSATVLTKFNEILGDKYRPGLTVAFGMTETSCVCVMNDEGPGKRRILNGGRLAPNVQIRIADENGDNLGIGKHGMIYIKVPNKWPGYLKNAKATNEALENGWIKSGDIGYFDTDGYLTICARESEVFKSCGFQIFPPHIEEVIMQLAGVLEVCVFGLPDDMTTNKIACAVVVTNDEVGKKLTKSDIVRHVKASMTKVYHLTGGVYLINSLPHTGSGKIIRRKVVELITNTN